MLWKKSIFQNFKELTTILEYVSS